MHILRIAPLLLLLTLGCAARHTDGTVNFHASMTETVLVAEVSYETILTSLGDAYRSNVISRPTLERGRSLGQRAYTAIETAKSTLSVYLRAGGMSGGSQADVFTALATLATLMAELEEFYTSEAGSVLPRSLE